MSALLLFTLMFFLPALIVVGLPSVILKLTMAPFMKSLLPDEQRKLRNRSICTAAVIGLLTIAAYVACGKLVSDVPFVLGAFTPSEVVAAIILVTLVVALDLAFWRLASARSGPIREGLLWLIGSNIWIAWAFCLMWFWGTLQLSDPCIAYPGALDAVGIDADACADDARGYWSKHSDLWETALSAARHANCPDCSDN